MAKQRTDGSIYLQVSQALSAEKGLGKGTGRGLQGPAAAASR